MSANDENSQTKNTLSLKGGTLGLKKSVDLNKVEQKFSHGRTKAVSVERKGVTSPRSTASRPSDASRPQRSTGDQARRQSSDSATVGKPADATRQLSASEREARQKALEFAKQREQEKKRKAEEDEARRREQEIRRVAEEAEAKRKAEDEAKRQAEDEERQRAIAARQAAEEARVEQEALATASAAPLDEGTKPRGRREDGKPEGPRRGPDPAPLMGRVKKSKSQDGDGQDNKRQSALRKGGDQRRNQKRISVADALAEDSDRSRSLASIKRQRERERQKAQEAREAGTKVSREVVVPEVITVGELANRMAERSADVVRVLMKMGVMATASQSIDADTAELVIDELGHTIKRVTDEDVLAGLEAPQPDQGTMAPRPPVVTVMGHVDHGKTSILDYFRQSNVVSGEAGGITQHIGAYQITNSSGQRISFLDTPGHAAFTEMRARGANVTDIVILVVAADDGLMPQTIEAIAHAKAANVPIIVAVNKCDKPGVDPYKVETELLTHEIQVENLGGDIQSAHVSALTGDGMEKLEEAIQLQSELLELQASPEGRASGAVVESKMEKGRGSVATVLVQSGTLRVGDIFVAGAEWGRVRALINDQGKQVNEAGPASPVEVLGLTGPPVAGDDLIVVETEGRAREVSEYRQNKVKETKAVASKGTLEGMFAALQQGEINALPIVIKGDVHGSIEAISASLEKLNTDEVKVNILHQAVGAITESDITLARASQALIVGFNVRANNAARDAARADGIDIRYFSIIYELLDDVKALMSGLLKPEERENFLGYAEILETFNVSKVGRVAGCRVTEGVVKRGASVRLLRDNVVIHEGTLKTLRRFKEEVKEVKNGLECGMAFENYQDIQPGDFIECFEVEQIARSL